MLFDRYHFSCRFETEAQLPLYKGSTFRGVFGRALKKVVCALRQQDCETCLLNNQCVYVRVFETPISMKRKDSRMAAPPHPFVIEPPLTVQTHFPAGSLFDFSLLLMGEANASIPYFIYAFEQMGRIGIGKKLNHQRGRFLIETVQNKKAVIYSAVDQKLNSSNVVEKLNLSSQETELNNHSIKVMLLTPLRLKFDNRLQAELPFHLLVRAMLRRVSSLMNTYGDGEPELDYSGLVKKAQAVKTIDNQLSWYDWQRYSFRQEEKMLMGGMTGTITYAGSLGEYLPLLKFCEQVHLGKQTTFGLGKIKAEIVP